MAGAVQKFDANVDDRITGDDAVEHRFHATCLAGVDEFFRDGAANDFVFDRDALAWLAWEDLGIGVSVLTTTTRLLNHFAFTVGLFCQSFAIGDLWLASVGFDFVLALETVAKNFQMQLTHAGDDRLTGFFVGL